MELGRFLNSRKQCAKSSFHVSAQSGRDRSASNSARRRREGADRSATVEQNDRNQATDDVSAVLMRRRDAFEEPRRRGGVVLGALPHAKWNHYAPLCRD